MDGPAPIQYYKLNVFGCVDHLAFSSWNGMEAHRPQQVENIIMSTYLYIQGTFIWICISLKIYTFFQRSATNIFAQLPFVLFFWCHISRQGEGSDQGFHIAMNMRVDIAVKFNYSVAKRALRTDLYARVFCAPQISSQRGILHFDPSHRKSKPYPSKKKISELFFFS